MFNLNQKGVIHLLVPILLLLGIIAGVYLITSGNPLKLFSRATNPPIVFKATDGSTLPTNSSGIPQATALGFKIILTSPFGPPATVSPTPLPSSPPSYSYPTPSTGTGSTTPQSGTLAVVIGPPAGVGSTDPSASPTSSVGTVSFKVAESPTALSDSRPHTPYQNHPQEVGYTLQDQTPGIKFIWVEFKDNTGQTDRRSAQIEIVAPSGGTGPGFQRVFITSTTYNGNLGGLSGADSKCQDRANAANLGGTWKAWVSDKTTAVASRLIHPETPYKLVNGTTIANNWSDLTDSSLLTPISVTELKTTNNSSWVWTGSLPDGSIRQADDQGSCASWTSSSIGGTTGDSSRTDGGWSDYGASACNFARPIYCFEQTSTGGPSPSSSPTPTVRSIKITYPNGGETFTVGDKVKITWDSSKIDKVSLGYSFGVGSLNPIVSNITNQGSYDWTVNIGNTTNTKVKIDIIGYETGVGSVTDQSDDFFTVNPSSAKLPPCEIYGDLNLDGKVTNEDAKIVSKIVDGLIVPSSSTSGDTQYMRSVGDVNGDNSITAGDALLIDRYIQNLDATFKVCTNAKPPACNNLGDVTTNGNVTPMDAYEALRMVVGYKDSLYTKKPYTDDQKKRADVDGNGNVTSTDALRISRYIKGTDQTFTVCSSTPSYTYPTPSYSYPTPSTFPPPPSTNTCTPCRADVNKSGGVDIGDFSFMVSCYNKKATDKNIRGKSCASADINGDGVINGQDYSCLRSQFGKKCQ